MQVERELLIKREVLTNSLKLYGKDLQVNKSVLVSRIKLLSHGIAQLVILQMMQLLSKLMYSKLVTQIFVYLIQSINAIIRNKRTSIMI